MAEQAFEASGDDLRFLEQIPVSHAAEPPELAVPEWLMRLPSAPTRDDLRKRRRVALGLSGAWLALHLAIYGIRQDLASLPLSYLALQVAWPLIVSWLCLALSLDVGPRGLGRPVVLLTTLGVGAPLSFAAIALFTPAPVGLHRDLAFGSMWLCFDLTLVCGALPLLFAALSLRKTFAGSSVRRAVLVGVAAGLFSGGILNLHCDNVEPIHMLFGHGAPMVALAALAAFGLERLLRI